MAMPTIRRLLIAAGAIALGTLAACSPGEGGLTTSTTRTVPRFNITISSPYVTPGTDAGYFHDSWTANNSGRAGTEFWDNFSSDGSLCNVGFYGSGTLPSVGCINEVPGSFANMPASNTYTMMWGDNGPPALAGNDPSSFTFSGATSYSVKLLGGYHGLNSEIGYWTMGGTCTGTALGSYCLHPFIADGDITLGPKPPVPAGADWGLYIKQGVSWSTKTITGCGSNLGYACSDAMGGFTANPNQQFALFTNSTGTKFFVGVEDNQLTLLGSPGDSDYNDWMLEITPVIVAPTGQIGDYVWEDENGDGIQGATEPGMFGVTVTLTGPVNATTTTDNNGAYLFTGLPAGSYTVTVGTPTGFTASPSNQGGDPLKDSNGSPASVTLATNSSSNLSIDFGFVPPAGVGRMTGGGVQFDLNGVRISRGLTLHCDIALSNNLEINWPGIGGTNNFHITRPLTSAQCILDPAYKQQPPKAPFNTFIGVAQGTLNGIPGATARFTFIDAGEPGKNDKTKIQIFDASNHLVLDVPLGNLAHGNLQAHYDQPHGNKP